MKMSAKQLKVACAKLGLLAGEQGTSFRYGIDIEIDAPDGWNFGAGVHCLVTHWYSNPGDARRAAYNDVLASLPLEACGPDCGCQE